MTVQRESRTALGFGERWGYTKKSYDQQEEAFSNRRGNMEAYRATNWRNHQLPVPTVSRPLKIFAFWS